MNTLRKWLLTGLLVLVPGVITVWVLHWVISTLDQTLYFLPEQWQPGQWLGMHIPGLGLVLTLCIVLAVGAAASNLVGRTLVGWGNAIISRIPVVRGIYSSVKQVSDTVFSDSGNAFRTAVLVQWPRPGMWTVAFVTGSPAPDLVHNLPDENAALRAAASFREWVSVFVPTTPNPTGGYLVLVRRSDCIALDMGVDAALKYVVSMGVVAPKKTGTDSLVPLPDHPVPNHLTDGSL